MRQVINSKVLNLLLKVLITVVIAKLIGLIVLYFLPKSPVHYALADANNVKYRNYKASKLFDLNSSIKQSPSKKIDNTLKIDNLLLHAIYGHKDYGFIVFARKSTPDQNHILSVGQDYEGYKLTYIKTHSAILQKNGTNYEIVFKDEPNSKPLFTRVSRPQPQQENETSGVLRAVKRKDVMHYAKNFKEIWKNIAIKEIKVNGKIDGFKIMSVKADSIFSQLGLKRGDVIKSVNQRPLHSYADAFKIYNNINKYESLKLEIIRNNQKKELEYEIF